MSCTARHFDSQHFADLFHGSPKPAFEEALSYLPMPAEIFDSIVKLNLCWDAGLWFQGDASVEWSQTIQPWLTE